MVPSSANADDNDDDFEIVEQGPLQYITQNDNYTASFKSFLTELIEAVAKDNGEDLAILLLVPYEGVKEAKKVMDKNFMDKNFKTTISQNVVTLLDDDGIKNG